MSKDQQRLRYPLLAPDGVAALSSLEHHLNAASGLEPTLLEFVRLRASQVNGCSYCMELHASELRRHNEPASRIEAVSGWEESDAYTERERTALRWAEVVTNIQQGHASDHEFSQVRLHFSDRELVELTLAIASINAWNRMAIAFRPQWHGQQSASAATARRGENEENRPSASERPEP